MAVLPTGIGPVTGYNIERSLRFNSADSAYLNRTPASAGNRKTWTWSGWVKRGSLGGTQVFLSGSDGVASGDAFYFANDAINYFQSGVGAVRSSSAVYRDPSAWYHIVGVSDSSNATAQNRFRIYVNGVEVTVWATNVTITQNRDGFINFNTSQSIGANTGPMQYFGGYLTEINFIDGQALTPSSFGETDSATGVWKPKAFSGTYGTNGFFLKFADNSNTTAATLGKDSSGNGNNWTPNNFSVTAGAGNDSLVDSPTSYGTDTGAGGTVRGNYCTLNPTDSSGGTISNGNLDVVTLTTGSGTTRGTIGISSGKWYWEGVITAGTGGMQIGIVATNVALPTYTGFTASGYVYSNSGNKENNSTSTAYGASYTTNDVIGVALDMDAGTLVFYKNGASQGTAFSSLSGTFAPGVSDNSSTLSSTIVLNFGQRPFSYTAPSGFKALCTQNLPTPTIGATSTTQANDYFNVLAYSGTGSNQTLTVGFQPDFAWFKKRSAAESHILQNSIAGNTKFLISNSTAAEDTSSALIQSFNSDGVTIGTSSTINGTSTTYAGWFWNAGGSTVTNTAGTITSTVSASTTSGFSIVTYTSTGSNATVGHGLGVAPSMIIVKVRNNSGDNWGVYHSSIGNTGGLILNLTNATGTNIGYWNNTSPTSSVFSVGSFFNKAFNYVAYCFAPVAGYSAFGSYTGNGSTDGPFVYTGFRPKYLLLKLTNTTGSWQVKDSARNTYNVTDLTLYPNLSNAEASDIQVDFLSNGFKLRSSTGENANGNTVIYAAFAESPFKYSLAR